MEPQIGLTIKRLREQGGFSQSQLARESGVPIATIQGIEQKLRDPRIHTAIALARALGVTLDELAGVELTA